VEKSVLQGTYLMVASYSITESLISDNLRFPTEEGLEVLLHSLQLLLVHLRETAYCILVKSSQTYLYSTFHVQNNSKCFT